MGKYKVEVTRITTRVKTFEVEAMNESEAIDRTERLAHDFDFNQVTGTSEYEGHVEESQLEEGDECPECGSIIVEGPNKLECTMCGKFF